MHAIDEFRAWTAQLTAAEKRFVSLLGKTRAGAEGGALMDLWAWVHASKAGDAVPAKLEKHLRTYLKRLNDLILDALRMLDQQNSPQARMSKRLQAAQLFFERGLSKAACRQLDRADHLAAELCRYDIQLQGYAFLRKMEVSREEPDPLAALHRLSDREALALERLTNLNRLRRAYDAMIAAGSQAFSGRVSFVQTPYLEDGFVTYLKSQFGQTAWLERSLAGNMLGIMEIFRKDYTRALDRYAALLLDWDDAPDRQKEEMNLFLNICKNYQHACFLANSTPEETTRRLGRMPSFQHLPPSFETKNQYLLYRERLSWVMSSMDAGMLATLRPEILAWLRIHWDAIGESRVLAIAFNLTAAEFLNENFSEALVILALILSKGKKVARKDIRDFSLVFQAVMHYEVGNADLNEYLIRAAKRRFSRHASSDHFEVAVLRCLTQCAHSKSHTEKLAAFERLHQDLLALESKLDARLQVVGLSELMIWCEARLHGKSLKEVFLTTAAALDAKARAAAND